VRESHRIIAPPTHPPSQVPSFTGQRARVDSSTEDGEVFPLARLCSVYLRGSVEVLQHTPGVYDATVRERGGEGCLLTDLRSQIHTK